MGRSYCLLFVFLLSLSLNAQNPEWINYTNGQSVFQNQRFEHRYKNTPQQLEKYSFKGGTFADTELQFAFLHNKMLQESPLSKKSYSQSELYVVDTAVIQSREYVVRIIYSYSQMGKITEAFHQEWRNNQWEDDFRTTDTYDTYGNCLSELYEIWKSTQWENTHRYIFTYDVKGNRLTSAIKLWSTNQWTDSDSSTFTYDAKGNLLSGQYQLWQNNKWTNVNYYTSTYDDNGNQLTNLFKSWKNDQWIDIHRTTYVYDEQGKQVSSLYEELKNSQWVINARWLYSYDADGNQILMVGEGWLNNQWTNGAHITSTFNTKGEKLTQLREHWVNNMWLNIERNTFSYDDNENQLMDYEEYWINDQWMNSNRYTFLYNQNNQPSEGNYEVWRNDSWEHSADGSFNVDGVVQGSSYFNGYKITLSYKQLLTDVRYVKEGIVKEYSLTQNFPNPFNPNTTINYSIANPGLVTVKIFNVLGEEILQLVNEYKNSGSYSVNFDASRLSSGIYFYSLTSGSFLSTKKMIVLK